MDGCSYLQEQRFYKIRYLGSIFHIDNQEPTSCTFHICEIRCFRLKLFEYGAHGFAYTPLLDQLVPFSGLMLNVIRMRTFSPLLVFHHLRDATG